MKKTKYGWELSLALGLLAASAFFFGLNYTLFHDTRFMANLVTLQLGFLPISVIILTLFLGRLIAHRERAARQQRISILIDLFFGEVGTPLLRVLSDLDHNNVQLANRLALSSKWQDEDFRVALRFVRQYDCMLRLEPDRLIELRDFLAEKRPFLMRMMENPSLLERESFTELLRALFHLTLELNYRNDLRTLPSSDYEHLIHDVRRAYVALLPEWVTYMRRLREQHPYFYSLETRINPLNPSASPVVA